LAFSTPLFYKRTDYDQFDREVFVVELQVESRLTNKLKGRVSYTFLNAIDKREDSTYPAQYDLNYFIKGFLEYDFGYNWTLTANFVLRSGAYYEPEIGVQFDQNLQVYEPTFGSENQKVRYHAYNTIDLSLSKLFSVSEGLVIIAFAIATNIFDFKNVRSYDYNFDYSETTPQLYSQRVFYFGAVLNF